MMPVDDKPATMVPPTTPEAPTVTRRPRRWLKIGAFLAALVAGAWLYSMEATKNIETSFLPATRADDNSAQVKQAPQQDRDKTQKLVGELTTTLAQVKQAPQQDRDKTQKLVGELTTDLAEVKQALQQERDRTEKLAGELATTLAQVKQAPQQDRDKTEKLAGELTTDLAQVKQALQQDRDKTEKLAGELATTLAQVKQAPQQDRDKTQKLVGELTTDLAQVKQALQQDRDRTEKLAGELTTTLAQVKQALKQTEWQSAAYGDLLALERTRNQGLTEQPAARRDATPGRSRNATASLSSTPDPTQAPATDKSATSQLPTSNKPGMPAGDKPATVAARPTAPEALGDPELARLISRASLLLSQGNIGTARIVLERAAETGSAPALFALAETYDPTTLAAWGTFGTQGDVAKARELYAKAFASGVQEAGDRLNALRE
jgi:septal ring factor EnvC (AmiA/AmiB activator)